MNNNDKRQLQNILIAVIVVGGCFIGYWYYHAAQFVTATGNLIATKQDFLPVRCTYTRANSLDFSEGRAYFYAGYARIDTYSKMTTGGSDNKYYKVHTVITPNHKSIGWLDDKSLGGVDNLDPNSGGDYFGLDANGSWSCSPWWVPSRAMFAVPSDVKFEHSDSQTPAQTN